MTSGTDLNWLISQFRIYLERYPEEKEQVGRFQVFFERHADYSYQRNNHEGHITSSALVVDSEGQNVLLLHHKKLGIWLQPGGHADGETCLKNVVLKEIEEETGLTDVSFPLENVFDIDVHLIPAFKDTPSHYHYDIRFLVVAHDLGETRGNEESEALQWVPLERLKDYTQEESIVRMAQKLTGHINEASL